MTIVIDRASLPFSYEKEKPCEGAYFKNGLWWMDINTLEELNEFVRVNGAIIIYSDERDGMDSICIYDRCVEGD